MNIHQIPKIISAHLNPKHDLIHLFQIEVSDFTSNNINEFNNLSILYEDRVSAEKRELRVCNNNTSFGKIAANENSSFFSLDDLPVDFNQVIDTISSISISYLVRSITLCNRKQNDREIMSYIVKGYFDELLIIDAFTGEYVPMNQRNSLPNFKSISLLWNYRIMAKVSHWKLCHHI